MLSIEQLQSEMRLLSQWANIPPEDYDFILTPPDGSDKATEHYSRALNVYENEFAEAKRVWDRLPLLQWETTKAIGRDLPEWSDLRDALIKFRKAVRTIRRIPKKVVPNAEGQSPKVPQ